MEQHDKFLNLLLIAFQELAKAWQSERLAFNGNYIGAPDTQYAEGKIKGIMLASKAALSSDLYLSLEQHVENMRTNLTLK
jgi:hypothetical protein